jgi:hypothetical protein
VPPVHTGRLYRSRSRGVSDPTRGPRRRPQARPRGRSLPGCRCPPRGRFVKKNWSQIGTRFGSPSRNDFRPRERAGTCAATAAGPDKNGVRGAGLTSRQEPAHSSASQARNSTHVAPEFQRRRPCCIAWSTASMWVGVTKAAESLRFPDCPGTLGRVKTALRRCAVLTRPARSRCWHLPERRGFVIRGPSPFAGHGPRGPQHQALRRHDGDSAKHITPLSI